MDSSKHNKGRVMGLMCVGTFILALFGLLALSTNHDQQHTSRDLMEKGGDGKGGDGTEVMEQWQKDKESGKQSKEAQEKLGARNGRDVEHETYLRLIDNKRAKGEPKLLEAYMKGVQTFELKKQQRPRRRKGDAQGQKDNTHKSKAELEQEWIKYGKQCAEHMCSDEWIADGRNKCKFPWQTDAFNKGVEQIKMQLVMEEGPETGEEGRRFERAGVMEEGPETEEEERGFEEAGDKMQLVMKEAPETEEEERGFEEAGDKMQLVMEEAPETGEEGRRKEIASMGQGMAMTSSWDRQSKIEKKRSELKGEELAAFNDGVRTGTHIRLEAGHRQGHGFVVKGNAKMIGK